jgi:Tfp pilus assembly protein FimT
MLTLCLLVVMAAFTWPALERPWSNQRLREAADQVRTAWARARIGAMSSGRLYLFRYGVDGNEYWVESQTAVEASADEPAGGDAQRGGATADAAEMGMAQHHALAEKVKFAAGETVQDTRAEMAPMGQPPTDGGGATWADPILFYPDGTTSTARVRLVNQYGSTIEVSLRGITGIASVGRVIAQGAAVTQGPAPTAGGPTP